MCSVCYICVYSMCVCSRILYLYLSLKHVIGADELCRHCIKGTNTSDIETSDKRELAYFAFAASWRLLDYLFTCATSKQAGKPQCRVHIALLCMWNACVLFTSWIYITMISFTRQASLQLFPVSIYYYNSCIELLSQWTRWTLWHLFNGYFPAHTLGSWHQNVSILDFVGAEDDWGVEVVVTTGAVRRTKLQSNHP